MTYRLIETMILIAFMLFGAVYWTIPQLKDKYVSYGPGPGWYRIDIYQRKGDSQQTVLLNGEPWPSSLSMRFALYVDPERVIKY